MRSIQSTIKDYLKKLYSTIIIPTTIYNNCVVLCRCCYSCQISPVPNNVRSQKTEEKTQQQQRHRNRICFIEETTYKKSIEKYRIDTFSSVSCISLSRECLFDGSLWSSSKSILMKSRWKSSQQNVDNIVHWLGGTCCGWSFSLSLVVLFWIALFFLSRTILRLWS